MSYQINLCLCGQVILNDDVTIKIQISVSIPSFLFRDIHVGVRLQNDVWVTLDGCETTYAGWKDSSEPSTDSPGVFTDMCVVIGTSEGLENIDCEGSDNFYACKKPDEGNQRTQDTRNLVVLYMNELLDFIN